MKRINQLLSFPFMITCLLVFGLACFSSCNKSNDSDKIALETAVTSNDISDLSAEDTEANILSDEEQEELLALLKELESINPNPSEEEMNAFLLEAYESGRATCGNYILWNSINCGCGPQDRVKFCRWCQYSPTSPHGYWSCSPWVCNYQCN